MENNANMAARYEREIPEGYEARIDGNKVIIEKKESEDETIRKTLVNLIVSDINELIKSADSLAYFQGVKEYLEDVRQFAYNKGLVDAREKQKDERELRFIEGKMEGVRQTCQEIKDAMSLFEPKDLTPFEFTFRDYIDSAIRYCLSGEGYQQYIKEWAADLLNLEKQKDKVVEFDHDREQKPAEWSEEDERMVQCLLVHLEGEEWVRNHGELENLYKWRDWLKSLRPQPHWKPSEYTLSLVKKVANGEMLTRMEQMAMETLCNDLQKLP